MLKDYENPNICYAIGDGVAVFLGPGTVNRQPASGVEEQISSIVKSSVVDAINIFDGTNTLPIITAANETDQARGVATSWRGNAENMAIMITNSVYLRKSGTTDRVYVGGVQTNV